MKSRIVICLNHFPHEVMGEGATPAQAQQRCDELTAAHKTRTHVARQYHFCTVPVVEAEATPA